MQLKLHKNATTTPAVRKQIQESSESVTALALRFGVHETTIRRWRKRTTQQDRSHTRHRLPISLSPLEEQLVVELRTQLRLSGNDIHEVLTRSVNPALSSSAIYRCLQRQGVNQLPPLNPPEPSQPFEQYECGYIHIDLKHLSKLDGEPAYVFVAIDRATRFVYAEIHTNRRAETAADFLKHFAEAFGHPIHTILTDNGSEFTDRFAVKKPNKPANKPSGQHPFDIACQGLDIEHKLTRPFHPQTNGMVERFNRRLNEELAQVPKQPTGHKHFLSHADRNAYILRFVDNYNKTRLRCLEGLTPLLALSNRTGNNTQAGIQEDGVA
jgi:transposase InsO family protein